MEDTEYQSMNFELQFTEMERNKKFCSREKDYYIWAWEESLSRQCMKEIKQGKTDAWSPAERFPKTRERIKIQTYLILMSVDFPLGQSASERWPPNLETECKYGDTTDGVTGCVLSV